MRGTKCLRGRPLAGLTIDGTFATTGAQAMPGGAPSVEVFCAAQTRHGQTARSVSVPLPAGAAPRFGCVRLHDVYAEGGLVRRRIFTGYCAQLFSRASGLRWIPTWVALREEWQLGAGAAFSLFAGKGRRHRRYRISCRRRPANTR